MQWLSKFIESGIRPDQEAWLQQKVRMSNAFVLIFGFIVVLPFLGISLIYFPPLAWIPVIGFAILGLIALFNYIGQPVAARFLGSLSAPYLAAIYTGYINVSGEPPAYGLTMIVLSFFLITFLLFDIREKRMLVFTSLLVFVPVVLIHPMNEWLEIDLENRDVIFSGWLSYFTGAVSAIMAAIFVTVLAMLVGREQKISAEALESLEESLEHLEKRRKVDEQRQWQDSGLNKLSETLRQERVYENGDYTKVLSFLVEYIGGCQAALFVTNTADEENPYLELVGAYALDRERLENRRVAFGEGLIGQCLEEQKTIIFRDVPDGYTRLTSGALGLEPSCILIMPLFLNTAITAVLEVSFLREPEERITGFLERASEGIAVSIASSKGDSRIVELREKLREVSEELSRVKNGVAE